MFMIKVLRRDTEKVLSKIESLTDASTSDASDEQCILFLNFLFWKALSFQTKMFRPTDAFIRTSL